MRLIALCLTAIFFTSCFNSNQISNRPDASSATVKTENPAAKASFYDLSAINIDGETVKMSSFKGKKIIILNVASECGFTPQYADWQKYYENNKDKVVVLGFPCNQFMGQEPGGSGEIKTFCQKNYGVTFPIFEKNDVKGKNKSPIYQWLTDKSKNGWNEQEPTWNFCKYLINENGELVNFFASKIKPEDKDFQLASK